MRNNFFEPGYELDVVKPDDWIEEPDVLLKQRNIQLLEMSTEVHRRWLDLTRQINESKLPDESQSTLITVKNPFVVVGMYCGCLIFFRFLRFILKRRSFH